MKRMLFIILTAFIFGNVNSIKAQYNTLALKICPYQQCLLCIIYILMEFLWVEPSKNLEQNLGIMDSVLSQTTLIMSII